MSLSVKTRFEVFKRDRFTCSYCGKHPPEVLLEVDHIVPVAGGGSDDIGNLTTACLDCHRGKGGRALEEGTAPAINRSAVAEMAERVEQAKAYMEILGTMQRIAGAQVWRVTEAWAKAYNAALVEEEDGTHYRLVPGAWPEDRSIKNFIKKLGLEEVLDAVDITASHIHWPGPDAVRYFYGVCHRSIREMRGQTEQAEQASVDAQWDEVLRRRKEGASDESKRIGEILLNYQEHGYATLEDAVAALWPSDG